MGMGKVARTAPPVAPEVRACVVGIAASRVGGAPRQGDRADGAAGEQSMEPYQRKRAKLRTMVMRFAWVCPCLLCALACGGKAALSEASASTTGGQSAAGVSSVSGGTSSSGGAAGGGGSRSATGGSAGGMPIVQAGSTGSDAGGSNSDAGPSCYVDPACNVPDAYIEIYDDQLVKLQYAFNPSCGACSPSCSDCRCGLWAEGSSGCGTLDLELAACSEPGGQGVCLDTTGNDPHYTDAAGKRWPMPRLFDTGQRNADQANGAVDLNLALRLFDGSGKVRDIPVSVHLCARIVATLAPCK